MQEETLGLGELVIFERLCVEEGIFNRPAYGINGRLLPPDLLPGHRGNAIKVMPCGVIGFKAFESQPVVWVEPNLITRFEFDILEITPTIKEHPRPARLGIQTNAAILENFFDFNDGAVTVVAKRVNDHIRFVDEDLRPELEVILLKTGIDVGVKLTPTDRDAGNAFFREIQKRPNPVGRGREFFYGRGQLFQLSLALLACSPFLQQEMADLVEKLVLRGFLGKGSQALVNQHQRILVSMRSGIVRRLRRGFRFLIESVIAHKSTIIAQSQSSIFHYLRSAY